MMIGRNNAGKSTIVEALRLFSLVVNRLKRLEFHDYSREFDLPGLDACVSPSLRATNVDLRHVCHQYGEPPATVEAIFDDHQRVTLHLTPENDIFGIVRNSRGQLIRTRQQAGQTNIPHINVLPQVRPFLLEEGIRDDTYVRGSIMTDLAPLHFRNQLRIFDDFYDGFVALAEETWPGLRIRELSTETTDRGAILALWVQDGPFVAEVGRMGHGLQIWLQAIWFLARSDPSQTLILDEPDVYLHADLQRRLVRHLLTRQNQVIMTTHAVDVLSEVSPEQILVVDKKQPSSSFATSAPAVQAVIDHIGAVHNLQLARLWGARRLLLVEGKDIYLLNPDSPDGSNVW
jgi:predicted ATP-dependent endonuclease of OLD family